jgi:hypothetical protein
MSRSLPKLWAVGALIIFIAQVAWFLSLGTESFSQVFFILLWGSSGIAAFLVSFLSPRRKLLLGFSLLMPAATLIAILNYLYQLTGHTSDFPGLRGAVLLFVIALGWNAVTCGIGTLAGYILSRRTERQHS